MNTQEKYLRRQLKQVVEEMKILGQKAERIQFRFAQLEAEKVALEVDLQGLTKQTKRRDELEIIRLRQKNHQTQPAEQVDSLKLPEG